MNGAFDDIVRNLRIGQTLWYRGVFGGIRSRKITELSSEVDLPTGITAKCLRVEGHAPVYEGNIDKWFLTKEEAERAPQV